MSQMEKLYKKYPSFSVHRNTVWNQYGVVRPWEFYQTTQSSKHFMQRLERWLVLDGHRGCVNTVAWNTNGYFLLTGSDDYKLNIYDVFSNKLIHSVESGHHANIFSAKFLPCTSDMKIVSCSGDGMLHYNELGTEYGQNYFNCHSGTTYEVLVTPGDPNSFLSCGEDGTVRMFDLRTKTRCYCQECSEDILIDCRHAVTSISVNPLLPYHLATGCKDSYVRVFDRRMLGTSAETRSVNRNRGWMPGLFCKFKPENLKKDMSCRVTSLQYSNDGKDLLVSYCTDYVYSFTVKDESGNVMNLNSESNNLHNGFQSGHGSNGHVSDVSDDGSPIAVKRLRLRGDWADTGPQARPETEQVNLPENNLMQRMSTLFSRWLEDTIHRRMRADSTSSDSSQYSGEQQEQSVHRETNYVQPSMPEIFNQNSRRNSQTEDHIEVTQTENNHDQRNSVLTDNCDENWMLNDMGDNNSCDDINSNQQGNNFYDEGRYQGANVETPNVAANLNSVESNNGFLSDVVHEIDNLCEVEPLHIPSSSNGIIGSCRDSCFDHEVRSQLADEDVFTNTETSDDLSVDLATTQTATTSQDDNDCDINERTPLLNPFVINRTFDNAPISNQSFTESQDLANQFETDYNTDDNLYKTIQERGTYSRHQGSFNRAVHSLNREDAASKIQDFLRTHKVGCTQMDNHPGKPRCIYMPNASMIYKGHRNSKTMIKEANFWGDNFVLSGSDCGRIFIWDRHTGELVMLLQGDEHVVNCVQPHPYEPILATSGIDHDIKIWAPISENLADLSDVEEIIKRNEKMLEESRDTITVPASFVLRMLASFGSIRSGGRTRQRPRYGEHDIDDE